MNGVSHNEEEIRPVNEGSSSSTRVAVIGAGPAGLTAAYELVKQGVPVQVFEADPEYVGGISRTARYKGFHFDIGGHRFFSKSKEIEDLWTEILPEDMLYRPRKSRIYYNNRFFSYPLKGGEALWRLGLLESFRCGLSYLKARIWPHPDPRNFEDWVSNQFGKRLFSIFFKTYTEKVWGMNCRDISADWAAQRIKGLSLGAAIRNALMPGKPKNRGAVIKTLIDSFRYPRKGPGMMWERCAQLVREKGGEIHMGQAVKSLHRSGERWQLTLASGDVWGADHVISSAPLREVITHLHPRPASEVLAAATSLRYRDFLTVVLIQKGKTTFDDNWVYIHDSGVQVGRIQNFKSWSPEMVPDPVYSCYGLEYFCFEGDGLWNTADEELIRLGKEEIGKIGLIPVEEIVDGCVVRQPKAYPVYDDHYAQHVESIRQCLAQDYPGLHLAGRNGMHKYNNQDHAMMTALLIARNIAAGEERFDPWRVNQDAEYHEAGASASHEIDQGGRLVPTKAKL